MHLHHLSFLSDKLGLAEGVLLKELDYGVIDKMCKLEVKAALTRMKKIGVAGPDGISIDYWVAMEKLGFH